MKKRILRTLSIMMAIALLLTSLPATAATVKDGKIRLTVGNNKSEFQRSGIKVVAYLIARGDYGAWTPIKQLEGLKFTTKEDDVKWVQETIKLLEYQVRNLKKTKTVKTDENGVAEFKNLEHGIYYIKMVSSPDALLKEIKPMLVAVPGKQMSTTVDADAKPVLNDNRRFPKLRNGEHYESIDEYETALGLGNIQIHVGVCFE